MVRGYNTNCILTGAFHGIQGIFKGTNGVDLFVSVDGSDGSSGNNIGTQGTSNFYLGVDQNVVYLNGYIREPELYQV